MDSGTRDRLNPVKLTHVAPFPSVISRAEALAAGMSAPLIDAYLRRGRWVALQRGIYAEPPVTPHLQAAAAMLAVPGALAVSHDTAARLHGIDVVSSRGEHLTAPRSARISRRRGLVVHTGRLDAREVCRVASIPTTGPTRTVRDLLLDSDRLTAIWATEHATRLGLVDLAEVAGRLRDRPGARRARERLSLVNSRSESPLETGIRLIAHDAGLPPLDLQISVWDYGRELFRIDMGYEQLKLGIEADGTAVHGTVRALYADRTRSNALEARGWRLLRFTWQDLARPRYVTASIRAALTSLAA